jgi:hypothetical protein
MSSARDFIIDALLVDLAFRQRWSEIAGTPQGGHVAWSSFGTYSRQHLFRAWWAAAAVSQARLLIGVIRSSCDPANCAAQCNAEQTLVALLRGTRLRRSSRRNACNVSRSLSPFRRCMREIPCPSGLRMPRQQVRLVTYAWGRDLLDSRPSADARSRPPSPQQTAS